jgi:hypothetical protein
MQPPSRTQPPDRPSKALVAAVICVAIVVMFVIGIFYHFQ